MAATSVNRLPVPPMVMPLTVLPLNPLTAMMMPFPRVADAPRVRVRLLPVVDPEVSWTRKVMACHPGN